MIIDKIDEKRDKFKTLLFRLAESQMTLRSPKEKSNIYVELESIYYDQVDTEEFRHFYSDIFAVLSQIDKDPQLGNTDAEKGKLIDISKQINKLYDHINLDIARINYSKAIESRTQTDLQKVNETLNKVETSVSKMEDNIKIADDMQKQYITILGIFASFVLDFTGGIAFSTSVLQNIANASIYRILLVAIALAFVLTNIIYILTRFILEVSKKQNEVIKYPKVYDDIKWSICYCCSSCNCLLDF